MFATVCFSFIITYYVVMHQPFVVIFSYIVNYHAYIVNLVQHALAVLYLIKVIPVKQT